MLLHMFAEKSKVHEIFGYLMVTNDIDQSTLDTNHVYRSLIEIIHKHLNRLISIKSYRDTNNELYNTFLYNDITFSDIIEMDSDKLTKLLENEEFYQTCLDICTIVDTKLETVVSIDDIGLFKIIDLAEIALSEKLHVFIQNHNLKKMARTALNKTLINVLKKHTHFHYLPESIIDNILNNLNWNSLMNLSKL